MDENSGELSFEEVAKKYPDFPRLVMRKLDTELRGVSLTERALKKAKEEGAIYDASPELGQPKILIGGVHFRDGSWVLGMETSYLSFCRQYRRRGSPYKLDVVDDRLYLFDNGQPVEEVFFMPVPAFFGKKTSRGTPMLKVVTTRLPGLLLIHLDNHCYFWEEKMRCKFCSFVSRVVPRERMLGPASLEDIYETVNELLKEEGQWTNICLLAGSNPRGSYPYELEVDEYIKVIKTLKRSFGTEKIYTKIVASAFPREGLLRLKEAGATTYQPHIEVWDEKLFSWICPGKAKYFGRNYWIESALSAVEIFGRSRVATQFVGGVELAQPYGFKTIEEALSSTLQGAEFFASQGVAPIYIIHRIEQGSTFYAQGERPAPLEYYVALSKGLYELLKKYQLNIDFNNYRAHPTGDLARANNNV